MKSTRMNISSALEQGVAHHKSNTPCQDRIYVSQHENFTFLGLADGAGSAENSGEGAEYILEQLSRKLQSDFSTLLESNDTTQELTSFIEIALRNYAEINEFEFHFLASTLLVVAIYENKYLLLHIGDGIIVRVNSEKKLKVLSEAKNAEFANLTWFTTSIDSKERLRIQKGEYGDIENGLLLCSDGIQDLIYDGRNNSIIPIVKTMIDWLDDNPSEEVSEHLSFNLKENFAQKSADDLSIIIMKKGVDDVANV